MNQQEARKQAQRLVAQMTVEEKLSQLLYNSPAIERLGIHEYNWWNEASHGVARAGTATVFPHAIALAATFDPVLVRRVGDAVSTEARAKYNKNLEYDDRDIYKGLTFWTPNINIFRDPRWGRGQETFGEDPYLTAVLGVSYIQGLQGDGEFLKSAACSKHFAGHSGPERLRHGFDARISDHDLWETYLPAFEWTVKSGVAGVMGAYNRTNGEPCCASRKLIQEILLGQWNFDGYFVSDCGAIADICLHHHYTDTMAEAAAAALKTGCNLNCGEAYTHLMDAYEQDLITEEDITDAAVRLYTIRFRLGEFETERPYRDISFDEVDSPAHNALNLEAAENAVVLLENKQDFLPIRRDACGTIAVIGPNAQSVTALEGNYNGRAAEYVTLADGVRRVFPNARIRVSQGSNIFSSRWEDSGELLSDALAAVSGADLAVLCLGYDRFVEGEELGIDNDCFLGGDRRTLRLPKVQTELAEAVCQRCENVVIVVMSGSAIDLGPTLRSKAKAILHAWYPGALGGLAVARILAGEAAPGGRLPVTFYREENPLPDFEDYSMAGRTYRYLTEEPLYPFGYGLNYGHAALSDATAAESPEGGYLVSVRVRNEAARLLTEKIQVYARFSDSRTATPNYQLCGVQAVTLAPGEEKTVSFSVDAYWLKAVDDRGNRIVPDGAVTLYVGTHQPDGRSTALTGTVCCAVRTFRFFG